jgi:hypothetical protein
VTAITGQAALMGKKVARSKKTERAGRPKFTRRTRLRLTKKERKTLVAITSALMGKVT